MRRTILVSITALSIAAGAGVAHASVPQYSIVDIGVVGTDTISQAFRISPGGIATGRSIGSQAHAYSWTQGGGIVGLPNLSSPARNFGVGNGVNDLGVVVGAGGTTLSGSGRLPLMWQGGTVSQLPLPAGQTLGDANDVNNAGVAVGSANSGSAQRGVIYQGGVGSFITQTTPGGSFVVTAFSINDSGRLVGQGIDPNNAARNVGYVLDTSTNTAFEVGALPGMNGALCFDVSNNGFVVGVSMLNQGTGTPFIWSDANGMTAIPLPVGTSQAGARGVNSAGWVVGTASSASAIPYVYDGTASYRLGDLIPAGSGWNLLTGTSNSAMGISEDGVIVGTGVFNGATHAYAMIPVPTPGASILLTFAGAVSAGRRRRR